MKKFFGLFKVLLKRKYIQRGALFFISIALILGTVEPGFNVAFAESHAKKFNSEYKIDPLSSVKQQNTIVTEQAKDTSLNTKVNDPLGHKSEDVSKRTAFSSTYINNDGTRSLDYGQRQQNYQVGKSWIKIDNSLKAVTKVIPNPTLWQTITSTQPKAPTIEEYNGDAGTSSVNIKSLGTGITIKAQGKTITMKPIGARDIKPVKVDDTSVIYKDAWKNVDIEYQLRGETVKEIIIVKDKDASTEFNFSVSGGKVINHPSRAGELTIQGMPDDFSFSSLTLDVNEQGVISEQHVTQSPTSEGIKVSLDKLWMQAQPTSSFPMRIDPSFGRSATSWWMFKSDGYSCGSSNCYANIGTIYSGGWKAWHTYMQFPYNELAGKTVLNANVHGIFKYGVNGITDGRWIAMGHANCISFYCTGGQVGSAYVGTDFDINFTQGLASAVNAGDFGAVWSFWGEEGAYKSYKPYYDMVATVNYDTPTPVATPLTPTDGQVTVDTQPSLKVNPVADADGDHVQYYFRVSNNPNAETGAVINSGWIDSPQWTVPQGVLQDGTTYYWHTYTKGALQTNPNWVRSFKVDLRTGKNSTQSYDTVGPVDVNLATGNSTISSGTHSMSALGGDMGLGLTYNTPNRAKSGLKGEYWNVGTNYNFANGAPTTTADLTRSDQNINFDWSTGSPGNGINNDGFYTKWTGQFVAPTSGTYQFGGSNDDNMSITINGQQQYNTGCYTGICYDNTKSVTLAAGQVVPIRVDYFEATGGASAKLYVKGAVAEQIVPSTLLYSDPASQSLSSGLTGRYYTDTGDHNIDIAATDPSRLMMVRQDTNLNLNFGMDGPAPGLQADNFMTRWTGYITVPTSGTYTLGMVGDDGARIKIKNGSSWTTLLDSWNYTDGNDRWGSTVTLAANTQIPIVVDYNEVGGAASFALRVKDTANVTSNVPTTWLTPAANVLPDQWKLSPNIGSNASYERLRTTSNSVILEDSTGSTHEYTYANGTYTPPVNENGTLSLNSDNTYNFLDTDGRTYLFDASGNLTSLTTPSDDRQPAALKYTYGGDPARLLTIQDGVTNTRYATAYYKGVNDTGNLCDPNSGINSPSTFFGLFSQFDQAPNGMLCAFKTSDGNTTNIYYKNGNIARIVLPGNQITDYTYDSLGRIVGIRNPLASDAIGANIRVDNDSVTTQMTYDNIGRISSVKLPSAKENGNRSIKSYNYMPGMTDMHIVGATEPNGYSKRIQYDSLFRTTSVTDLTGKTAQTEWDPVKDLQLSSSDAMGLKSTTIYDQLDRAIDSYGPAPAAWFKTDVTQNSSGINGYNTPIASYADQVPHSKVGYDEGISGLGITMFDNTKLLGTPKLYTTGMNNLPYGSYGQDIAGAPVTATDGLAIRATGKIRLDKIGNYSFKLWHGDGARVYIDNTLVSSDWADGVERFSPTGSYSNNTVGKYVNITIETYKKGASGTGTNGRIFASLNQLEPGSSTWTEAIGSQLTPTYNLTTSSTAYDSQLGNNSSTTQYNNPAYGQIGSTTLDPTGLNYLNKAIYENPGTGFLRQTSKTLPGGAKTTYRYYGKDDTADNPCTPEIEAYHQAGKPSGKTDPDPDGTGPLVGRSSDVIYNESGATVATRYNNDPWTCVNYDARGRILKTTTPSINGQPGRTIENNYSVDGNPLISTITDSNGTIRTESDLLGHVIRYVDAKSKETLNTYDDFGHLTTSVSPLGTQAYEYDQYDRLVKQKLDGVTFSTVSYDAFSRVQSIQYPAGISLEPATRDNLGRVNTLTYKVGSQTITDATNLSVSGMALSGNENGIAKSYGYDKAARLTSATIGSNTYSYEYGSPDSSCSSLAGYNANAGKDSNRTKMTINGISTTYCYNMADQLISSSDGRFTNATYDTHGNTTGLGDADHLTAFAYDNTDRNTGIKEQYTGGDKKEVSYNRDAQDRLINRTYKVNDAIKAQDSYGYTGSSDSPSFLMDTNGAVTQKYLSLVGGVSVTIKPQSVSAGATTYSLTNFHGDTMATVNADGLVNMNTIAGPFGEKTQSQSTPSNTAAGATWDYLGAAKKTTDSEFSIAPTQMGARVYIAQLGRFLQMDPVEGGTANNYVYVTDPVNQSDINGKWALVWNLPWASIASAAMSAVAAVGAFLSAPVVIVAAAVVAVVLVATATVIYFNSNANTRSTTASKTQTQVGVKPKEQPVCRTYTPDYTKTVIQPATARVAQINATTAVGVGFIVSSLQAGIKPGRSESIVGVLNDPQFAGWSKYAFTNEDKTHDFHYSINDATCQYADIKDTWAETGKWKAGN